MCRQRPTTLRYFSRGVCRLRSPLKGSETDKPANTVHERGTFIFTRGFFHFVTLRPRGVCTISFTFCLVSGVLWAALQRAGYCTVVSVYRVITGLGQTIQVGFSCGDPVPCVQRGVCTFQLLSTFFGVIQGVRTTHGGTTENCFRLY